MIRYYYTIIKNEGCFEKGMMCYCFAEDENYLYLFFRKPIVGLIHEVKLPKSKIYLLKRTA